MLCVTPSILYKWVRLAFHRFKKQESMEANLAHPYRVDENLSTTFPGIMITVIIQPQGKRYRNEEGQKQKRTLHIKTKKKNDNDKTAPIAIINYSFMGHAVDNLERRSRARLGCKLLLSALPKCRFCRWPGRWRWRKLDRRNVCGVWGVGRGWVSTSSCTRAFAQTGTFWKWKCKIRVQNA